MRTSQTSPLSKPEGDAPIAAATLAYMRARGRQQTFNFLHSLFRESGITKAMLARRTGKPPEVISRIMTRPSNLEQDTISELVFAMSGGGVAQYVEYPTAKSHPMSNARIDQPTTTGSTSEYFGTNHQLAEAA